MYLLVQQIVAYRFIKLQVPISDLMWNNKVDRIIWILGSVKTTNEKNVSSASVL